MSKHLYSVVIHISVVSEINFTKFATCLITGMEIMEFNLKFNRGRSENANKYLLKINQNKIHSGMGVGMSAVI
jgi:hypothetical protein